MKSAVTSARKGLEQQLGVQRISEIRATDVKIHRTVNLNIVLQMLCFDKMQCFTQREISAVRKFDGLSSFPDLKDARVVFVEYHSIHLQTNCLVDSTGFHRFRVPAILLLVWKVLRDRCHVFLEWKSQ